MMNSREIYKMKSWKIWFRRYNAEGQCIGGGILHREYKYKSSASRYAKRHFSNNPLFIWTVSIENPLT